MTIIQKKEKKKNTPINRASSTSVFIQVHRNKYLYSNRKRKANRKSLACIPLEAIKLCTSIPRLLKRELVIQSSSRLALMGILEYGVLHVLLILIVEVPCIYLTILYYTILYLVYLVTTRQ